MDRPPSHERGRRRSISPSPSRTHSRSPRRRSYSPRKSYPPPDYYPRDQYYDRYYDRGYDPYYYDRYYDRQSQYRRSSPPPRPKRYEVIKGSETERNQTTCLYVGNLPYSFREPDVQEMFEKCGRLASVNVPIDRVTGRNKGFAFLQYEDRKDAEDAISRYTGYPVEGRKLRIDWDIGRDKKDMVKGNVRDGPGPGVDRGPRERDGYPPREYREFKDHPREFRDEPRDFERGPRDDPRGPRDGPREFRDDPRGPRDDPRGPRDPRDEPKDPREFRGPRDSRMDKYRDEAPNRY